MQTYLTVSAYCNNVAPQEHNLQCVTVSRNTPIDPLIGHYHL